MISVDLSTWLWPGDFAPSGAIGAAHGGVSAGDVLGRLPGCAPKRIYRGTRLIVGGRSRGCAVDVIEGAVACPLNPRLDLKNLSPAGFEWGFAGQGPAQLALAMLADALHDDERAVALHQSFKFACVLRFSPPGFEMTAERVRAIADELAAQAARRV